MKPRFSIVIPAYNRPQALRRTLYSCVRQFYTDFEIILVDDGSEEDLESIVRRLDDSRIRYFRQNNRGSAAARNKGVQLSSGAYIAFLDSDDAFLPDKLQLMSALLRRHPDRIYCSRLFIDRGVGKFWIKPSVKLQPADNMLDYIFRRRGWVQTSTIVLAADAARRIPFDESLPYGQDAQFAIDLWRNGLQVVMLDQPLVLYNDARSPTRISQRANVDANGIGPYQPYLDWIENLRPLMPEKAYYAWRAKSKARLLVSKSPGDAFHYLWTAYRSGALNVMQTLRQAIQLFMPKLYWRLSTAMVRCFGIEPPESAAELRPHGDGPSAGR